MKSSIYDRKNYDRGLWCALNWGILLVYISSHGTVFDGCGWVAEAKGYLLSANH
jgi:hypothetical protein